MQLWSQLSTHVHGKEKLVGPYKILVIKVVKFYVIIELFNNGSI